MSHFFINRPVFAWVVGLIIMLVGLVAVLSLPIMQYPAIAPTQISLSVNYPGASAETVNNTVVRPVLQSMFGLDNLEYISASSQSTGKMSIDLTFEQGTNPDIAQVQVQNKLALAQPQLPIEVQQQGVSVVKATHNFMLVLGFVSTDGSMQRDGINDYVASYISDPISRVPGVGDTTLFGSEYAMRIWVDPVLLYKYGMTISDVTGAISEQNIQISAGELGGVPAKEGILLDATILGPGRLENVKQFKDVILKVQVDGSVVRLQDVATVELGAQNYNFSSFFNNQPASGLAIKLASGANQLTTQKAVLQQIEILKEYFPPGLKVVFPLDTRPFIVASIQEVVRTLLEAVILVFVVMFIFLQNIRATLVPTIAVPIVLLGVFGVFTLVGYSINTLTMLAMVLAVGLLVDDAIVVVENVERIMGEKQLTPKQASHESMDEISSALIGIALVLAAVFAPMGFMSGSVGVIYRQFSVTIISAMALSVLIALTLTPALCATMLKPAHYNHENFFTHWFNDNFNRLNERYQRTIKYILGYKTQVFAVYFILTALAFLLMLRLPTSFLPDEDQGILYGQLILPPGATQEQTAKKNREITDYILKTEKQNVQSVFSANGFGFAGMGQNTGTFFVSMKPWNERKRSSQSAPMVAARLQAHFASDQQSIIIVTNPPAIRELGNATGFDLELTDSGNIGREKLMAYRDQLVLQMMSDKRLTSVFASALPDSAQYRLKIDWEKAKAQGISVDAVNKTISGAFAPVYVNQFTQGGRTKQVYVQGIPDGRMLPSDLAKWYVRNSNGNLVPFNSFVSGEWTQGSQKIDNYNGELAFEIQGQAAPGYSSGQAMKFVEDILKNRPSGVGYSWTGLSYEEIKSGSQLPFLYILSALVVVFSLAALYESWAIPSAVILIAPIGILGSILATSLRGLANDVYFQIGMLTTLGLAVKNAILIVEFAKNFFESGNSLEDSVIMAGRERLRPILMTSIAFVLGVVPLSMASGAGSAAQTAIGTAVVGGMITATFLAIFFVPIFFVSVLQTFRIKRLSERIEPYSEEMQGRKEQN